MLIASGPDTVNNERQLSDLVDRKQ
jgi:hypothetical protein